MTDKSATTRRIRVAALLGAGLAAGVVGATALGASAQGTTSGSGSATGTAPVSGTSGAPTAPGDHWRGGNGEVAVTGTKADQLKAAALKQVPGGTVDSVTTETDDAAAAYEVHVTKADGTHVTVLFDKDLAYVSTETGGPGARSGPGGHGGPGGPGGGNGETPVTGAKATTLTKAALAKVPGATVEQVSTDSGDAAYEVHLRKSDGSEVTVKFDKDLAYVATEDGRGK
ncbi:MAG: PepSY domain-containing protein [Jatrophihabitans sp.]|uniref:PepSY domain-containing protein n=1 Tax=Jatrophihabitans sp. TaxID=1932789 RepID=UPI003F7D7A43